MKVNIRCPFRIEHDAASVWADPGAVIALLLRCVLSQLSVERDPAVFENLDARPVSDRAGRRKIQKRTKIDAAQVFKKVHICLLHRLSDQLHLHHRGTGRKIQLTSYINFSPEIHIVSRYIVVRKSDIMKKCGVRQSFSALGRPHDNAIAESFFASFKKEEAYRREYTSEQSYRKSVEQYIRFYNELRPHRTLKYKTPQAFEEAYRERL